MSDGALGTVDLGRDRRQFGRYHEVEAKVRHGIDPLTNVNPAWYFRRPGGGPLYDMTVYGLHAMTGCPRRRQAGDGFFRRAYP